MHVNGGSLTVNASTFSAQAFTAVFNGLGCENGGVVSIEESTFNNVEIADANCELAMRRSTMVETGDGGIQASGGKLTLENNLFHNGGQYPDGTTVYSVLPGSVIRFNTWVDYFTTNDRGGTALTCDASVDVSSNLFAFGHAAVFGTGCAPHDSMFDDAAPVNAGINNSFSDLTAYFVSATDFHLSATSPARGKGESGTGVTSDLEGNPRPATMPDVGAYQAQ